jgi:branched-chain amino acid transport system ATP-binding protein
MEPLALLDVSHVSRAFGGLKAVDDVTLAVAEGEIVGLIGPNGAGKTTLFGVVSGSLAPTAGSVRFGGQVISGLRPDVVCELGVARTYQIVKPFPHLSVLENVMVGAFKRHPGRADAEAHARQVLRVVGLEREGPRPAGQLTLASRKRLEVARALATEPRLLLLDEVMAGLTPTEMMHIVALIQELRQSGLTVVVIEHVMRAIMALSDRVVVLDHGRLIAQGAPDKIVQDPAVIEAYLGEEMALAGG